MKNLLSLAFETLCYGTVILLFLGLIPAACYLDELPWQLYKANMDSYYSMKERCAQWQDHLYFMTHTMDELMDEDAQQLDAEIHVTWNVEHVMQDDWQLKVPAIASSLQ